MGPAGQGDRSLRLMPLLQNVRARIVEIAESPPPINPPAVPFSLVSVYRQRNTQNVIALQPPVGSTYLWALDNVEPSLSEMTYGHGSGNRFELLNKLLSMRISSDDWLVVIDDDVRLTRGSLTSAVATAALGAFDLCGLSHSRWSYLNWGCTLHKTNSIARVTRYVEQGPCLILSPSAQKAILPFPEDIGMGWGVEAVWGGNQDLRLGILDAVHLRHLRPVSRNFYGVDSEWAQAMNLLAASGFSSWSEMQRTLDSWNYGQPTPPWNT
jgi:hypothetical protein